MKAAFFLAFFLFLFFPFLYSQQPTKSDTIKPNKGNVDKQLHQIKEKKIKRHSDTLGNEPLKSVLIDTTIQNKYGDLLLDDPEYNKKYPLWRPALEVLGADVLTWAIDRLFLNADYSRIGITTWENNVTKGNEWDNDKFGMNFVVHPYAGTLSFNAARSNGYNYFQSFPFALSGSLLWEYFGENTRPSYNDLINTPINGAFLGEILYRLSSNILDDRTRGRERLLRELAAGLIDPMRGFNRLIQKKCFRTTNKEIYAKEPINLSLYAGLRLLNDETEGVTQNGTYSGIINVLLDYGNPFEVRSRKAFDFFKLRADLNFGVGKKFLDNITGYGILFGKNKQLGKLAILIGGYQYYDYWDNNKFELGTIGFGGGAISKYPISKLSNLYTGIHLVLVPLAGNSTRFGPDTSHVRDYIYGGGLQGKFESTLNIGKFTTASIIYYFYMISTYIGPSGNNYIHIIKPKVTLRIYKSLSIGYEYSLYYNDRYLSDYPAMHLMRTEQKLFLLFYLEDPQRRGQYK